MILLCIWRRKYRMHVITFTAEQNNFYMIGFLFFTFFTLFFIIIIEISFLILPIKSVIDNSRSIYHNSANNILFINHIIIYTLQRS